MKRDRWKLWAVIIFMLAAGICYSLTGACRASLKGDSEVYELGERAQPDSGAYAGLGDYGGAGYLEDSVGMEKTRPKAEQDAAQNFGGAAGAGQLVGGQPGADQPGAGQSAGGQPGADQPAGGQPGADQSAGGQTAPELYVHICGEVVSPGVYRVPEGSRIFQVVEEAGGLTKEAAGDYLNMAQVVCDGMKITVPDRESVKDGTVLPMEKGEGGFVIGTAEVSDSGGGMAKVNINTASKEQLMTLKGIGEAKASDIIRYREEKGAFSRIEDIMKISGIKEAAFQKIKSDITVK